MTSLRTSLLLLLTIRVYAATLTLTGPVANVSVPDGPEFATSVLHRPWDMSQLRQITRDFGFATIQSTGGVWSGVSGYNPNNNRPPLSGPSSAFKLFVITPNFLRPPPPGSTEAEYIPYSSFFTNGTPYGHLFPLDASTYSRLSFRMSLPSNRRSNVAVWWTTKFNTLPETDLNFVQVIDSLPTFSPAPTYDGVAFPIPTGYRIYDIDPNRGSHHPEQNTVLAYPQVRFGGAWDGQVYGFFIEPSDDKSKVTAVDAVPVSFDWIRAYDPDQSPEVTVAWTSSGLSTSFNSIQVYIDNNASGYDGDLLMDGLTNDGSFTLKTGALPPGDYWVYLRGVTHQNSTISQEALSNYSARIRIGEPPLVEITAPSYTSGEDYATSELGNPWDFSDTGDWLSTAEMSQVGISNGIFSAVTDPPIIPPESDDRMLMNTTRNGQVIPINPQKYRYFSFRMRVPSEAGYGDLDDKLERGWLSRLIWWNTSYAADGNNSKDIPLLEGWRTYTVDLWDNGFLEDPALIGNVPQPGWEELPAVRNFRFDPLEAHFPTRFEIDWMSLNAESLLSNGTYQIQWNITDEDSGSFTVRLFADPEIRPGVLQRTSAPIHTATARPSGAGSYTWSPGNLSLPVFIRVEVSDGSHTVEKISQTPITTSFSSPSFSTLPVRGDYDGDGKADLMVFEPSTGRWYLKPSSGAAPLTIQWGDSSMIPVPGDYTGDGLNDLALYQPSTGFWFIRTLQDGPPVSFGQQWGGPSLEPVSGDFDGDGVHDLAVYQTSTGFWFIRSLGPVGPQYPPISFGQQWGGPGLTPVSGDFDGDGNHDLAVYQDATGAWFIRSLGPIGPAYPPINFGQVWGGSTLFPVSGDYNGDGISDLAAYQPITGAWYIRSLGPVGPGYPPITFGQIWGDSTLQPVPGDYDGDGSHDLAIYQGNSGLWYVRKLGSGPPIKFGEKWGNP